MTILILLTKINLEGKKGSIVQNFRIIVRESTAYSWDFILMEKKTVLLLLKKLTKNVFEEKEDHYSIIQEPSSMYVSHVSPSIGSVQNNANTITSYLRDIDFSLNDVDVIGCDNTLASQKVVCSKNRYGFIRIMQLSRLSMPSFSN